MKIKEYYPYFGVALIRTLIILGFCLIFMGIGLILENLTFTFRMIGIVVFIVGLYLWILRKAKKEKSQIYHKPNHDEINRYIRRCIVIKYHKHNVKRHDDEIGEPDLILQIFNGEDLRKAYLRGFHRSSVLSGHSL